LTEILQGVRLEKAYTRLDWTTRPLPDGAIEYALDDVRYLIKNYPILISDRCGYCVKKLSNDCCFLALKLSFPPPLQKYTNYRALLTFISSSN
jgi:hypothetical protein